MKITVQGFAAGTLAVAFAIGLAACVTQEKKSKLAVERFKQSTSGQYQSASGAELFIVPVRARMVTDEALYVERHDARGTFGRLLNIELSPDGKKIIQRALTFTQEGQWRNLHENPELFTALLPKDVRPAGTCDIQPTADLNAVSYSCGGSPPEVFKRKQ
ncbi:MAG TPA: hypothetical protein VGO61_20420 [Steroidobacteraceae bacterium]|jgi:hypothetical protein|nr:hypothetical protein [Steroidobacteraceae bacterium]